MINFQEIQQIICKGEGITPSLLQDKTRKREIVFTRQTVIYFLHRYTRESLLKIGKHYGKDHATALHSIKVIKNLIETDRIIRTKIANYERIIKSNDYQYKFDKHLKNVKYGFPVISETIMIYN
jgi:chromosomal replication initiation ATPase DnaA